MADSIYPLPPHGGVDWAHLSFAPIEVNGHVECHYEVADGSWTEPVFIKDPFIRIHGLAPGLNYGQQIFEGMKAFRTPSGEIRIFRPDKNAQRFARSAKAVAIPAVPEDIFMRAVNLAVGANSEYVPPSGTGASLYVRPVAFASSATVGLFLSSQYTFCVYVMPAAPLHGGSGEGAKALVVEDFDRAAPLATGHVKIGGNYGPVLGIIAEAKRSGYGLTLHLDSRTHTLIDEFSTSGFVGILKTGATPKVVVPESRQIIDSVTVNSLCEIARSIGWDVERRPVSFAEIAQFSEVYAAGTAAVLVPVGSIFRQTTNEHIKYKNDYSSPKSAFVQLATALRKIQQGMAPDPWGWTRVVERPISPKSEFANGNATVKPTEHMNGFS